MRAAASAVAPAARGVTAAGAPAAAPAAAARAAAPAVAISVVISALAAAAAAGPAAESGMEAPEAARAHAAAAFASAAAATAAGTPGPLPGAGLDAGAYWEFMGGIGRGDVFRYRICDVLYGGPPAPAGAGAAAQAGGGATSGACYEAALRVEAVVKGMQGRMGEAPAALYVIRADRGSGPAPAADGGGALLVVDSDRFSVRHVFAGDRPLAESLQRTVFWRDGWGGRVQLAYGAAAVELIKGVPSTALLVSGSGVSADGGRTEHTASHGVRAAYEGRDGAGGGVSTLTVAEGTGLPVSARIYSGARPPLDHYADRPLFELELVEHRKAPLSPPHRHLPPSLGAAWQHPEGAPINNPHYTVQGAGGDAR